MKTINALTIGVLFLSLTTNSHAFFGRGGGNSGGGGRGCVDCMSATPLEIMAAINSCSGLSYSDKAAYKALIERSWPKIKEQLDQTNTNIKELADQLKDKSKLEEFIKNLPQEPDKPLPIISDVADSSKDRGNRPPSPPDGSNGGGGKCSPNGCPPNK